MWIFPLVSKFPVQPGGDARSLSDGFRKRNGNGGIETLNESATIKRKIFLKGQALKLIRLERQRLQHRLFLLRLRDFYTSQIQEEGFDSDLSRKIDAVNILLGEG